jgi:hypothetical protein
MPTQPSLIASIAASIAPLRVTPQPVSSYRLHGLILELAV